MRLAKYSLQEIAGRLATVMEDINEGRMTIRWMTRQLELQPAAPKNRRRRMKKLCARTKKRLPELERQKEILTEATRLAIGIADGLMLSRRRYAAQCLEATEGDGRTRHRRQAKLEAKLTLETLRAACDHAFLYGHESLPGNALRVCGRRSCAVCGLEESCDGFGDYAELRIEDARIYRALSRSEYVFRARISPRIELPTQIIDLFTTQEMLDLLESFRAP